MAVVLITGCSSGFGLAAALAFARRGDTVYASMRDCARAGPLREAVAREKLLVQIVELDVTQPASFGPLIADIVKKSQRLDVLVNNAGVLRAGAFEDLSEGALREVVETNLFAPLLLTRAVLPQMRAQRSGYIIMISSLSGIAGLPGDVAYTASKFALEGATEALRHEVDRWGIKLALVQAALYATRIFARNMTDESVLPADYPGRSEYRPLVEHRLREVRARLPQALDPAIIGELLVEISRSDGRQLRWPADVVAKKVLATMFAQDDAARDSFLRGVSGTDWWSAGAAAPPAAEAE
jgi:NAD(P)-dependent dehydrogenase (short-subunit alcohol dehydrogenase family)